MAQGGGLAGPIARRVRVCVCTGLRPPSRPSRGGRGGAVVGAGCERHGPSGARVPGAVACARRGAAWRGRLASLGPVSQGRKPRGGAWPGTGAGAGEAGNGRMAGPSFGPAAEVLRQQVPRRAAQGDNPGGPDGSPPCGRGAAMPGGRALMGGRPRAGAWQWPGPGGKGPEPPSQWRRPGTPGGGLIRGSTAEGQAHRPWPECRRLGRPGAVTWAGLVFIRVHAPGMPGSREGLRAGMGSARRTG